MVNRVEQDRRTNVWIQTHTGKKFYPWRDTWEDVDIVDIARGLSQTPRWRGQYKASVASYCVAQHSVLVSQLCEPRAKLWGLLHDSPEAIIGDMAGPIKHELPDFCRLDRRLCARFRSIWLVPYDKQIADNVKAADRWMLFEEGRQLLANPDLMADWGISTIPFPGARPVEIGPMSLDEAMDAFLREFERLQHERLKVHLGGTAGGHREIRKSAQSI